MRNLANWVFANAGRAMAVLNGYEIGQVKDIEDPWHLGRIRVRFPWHGDDELSDWAVPASQYLGDAVGSTFAIPRVDDVVVCYFYNGNVNRPAYAGGLWTPGGSGPQGSYKARQTLIKGKSPQEADTASYDPARLPNDDAREYPEPATGAWITNNPNSRVDEWQMPGGWRLLVEAFKRRLRFWTHSSTPFIVQIEHFDSGSYKAPRDGPYHRLRVSAPGGAVIEVENDNGDITVLVSRSNKSYLKMSPDGTEIQADGDITINTTGAVAIGDAASGVALGGGGKPVARVGDHVQVAGMTGVIVDGSNKVSSG